MEVDLINDHENIIKITGLVHFLILNQQFFKRNISKTKIIGFNVKKGTKFTNLTLQLPYKF